MSIASIWRAKLSSARRNDSYVCSLSARTIVYKALCAGRLLHEFYPDLQSDKFVTPFAIFHQRYATNVLPSWHRAQPLRMLAHNGEINTIWGNRAHIETRRATLPRECEPILTRRCLRLDEPGRGRGIAGQPWPQCRGGRPHDAAAGRLWKRDCLPSLSRGLHGAVGRPVGAGVQRRPPAGRGARP